MAAAMQSFPILDSTDWGIPFEPDRGSYGHHGCDFTDGKNYTGSDVFCPPLRLGIEFTAKEASRRPEVAELAGDAAAVETVLRNYLEYYGPIVLGHRMRTTNSSLVPEAPTAASASAEIVRRRLVVQAPIAHSAAAIFALMIALSLPMIFGTSLLKKRPSLLCNPSSLAGAGVVLSYPTQLSRNLCELSPPSRVARSWYAPWVLYPSAMLSCAILNLAVIAVLGGLLKYSQQHDGIAETPGGDSYGTYLWTIIPTLIIIGFSFFFDSIDFEIRTLAPFAALRFGPDCFETTLGACYTDEIGFKTCFKALRRRNWLILSVKTAAVICEVLPIIAAGLFTVRSVSVTEHIGLRQQTWFASGNVPGSGWDPAVLAGDLILNQNMSYPAWTFADLAFPHFEVVGGRSSTGGTSRLSSSSVKGRVPAIRSKLNCTYSSATADPKTIAIDLWHDGNRIPCEYPSASLCYSETDSIFGAPISKLRRSHCSERAMDPNFQVPHTYFIWGKCKDHSPGDDHLDFLYAASYLCNETFEEVDVDVSLLRDELAIDSNNPPIPDDSTGREYNMTIEAPNFYSSLEFNGEQAVIGGMERPLGNYFLAMMENKDPIARDWLANESHKDAVAAAIRRQYGILRAQTIVAGNMTQLSFSDKSPFEPFSRKQPKQVDALRSRTALRVVQQKGPTYALLALFVLVWGLSVPVFLFSMSQGYRELVPEPPLSIGTVAGLLDDPTLLGCLRELRSRWVAPNAEEMKPIFNGWAFKLEERGDRSVQGISSKPAIVMARSGTEEK
jgi:hypothetical protein